MKYLAIVTLLSLIACDLDSPDMIQAATQTREEFVHKYINECTLSSCKSCGLFYYYAENPKETLIYQPTACESRWMNDRDKHIHIMDAEIRKKYGR